MQAEWRNTARTILALTDDTGHVVIVEPGHDLWSQASARPDIAPFVIEPVATEPLVDKPVCLDFDPAGRIWVCEMRGYMPDIDGKGETNLAKPTADGVREAQNRRVEVTYGPGSGM